MLIYKGIQTILLPPDSYYRWQVGQKTVLLPACLISLSIFWQNLQGCLARP
jgi:hypothetical protein